MALQPTKVDAGGGAHDLLDDAGVEHAKRGADAGEDGIDDSVAHDLLEKVGRRGGATTNQRHGVAQAHRTDRVIDDRRRLLGTLGGGAIHHPQELVLDKTRPQQGRDNGPAARELGRQGHAGEIVGEEAIILEQSREGALRGEGEQAPNRALEIERAERRAAGQDDERAGEAGEQVPAGEQRVHGNTPTNSPPASAATPRPACERP